MSISPARRRYNKSILLLSAGYALVLVGVLTFFRNGPPIGVSAYLAAVLPALPIIGMFVALGRYLLDETDEYIRMLMVRQTLWASAIALSVATVWGFLENFGLVGHIESYYIAVLWFGGLGVGSILNKVTSGRPS